MNAMLKLEDHQDHFQGPKLIAKQYR